MSDNNEFARMEVGKKYTIVGMGEFGFPYQRQVRLTDTPKRREYAQYSDAVELRFLEKRKRTAVGIVICGIKKVAIYEGWIEADTEMLSSEVEESTPGVTSRKSKYASCDVRYFTDAVQSVDKEPIWASDEAARIIREMKEAA